MDTNTEEPCTARRRTKASSFLRTPIAWPSYAAYPPDRDARGNLVDYALAKHGGIFKDAKKEHPDLKFARESRSAGYAVNQHHKLRHAGLWHY